MLLSKSDQSVAALSRCGLVCGDMQRGLGYARDAERRFAELHDPVGATRAVLIQAQALRKMGDCSNASLVAQRGFDESVKRVSLCRSRGFN